MSLDAAFGPFRAHGLFLAYCKLEEERLAWKEWIMRPLRPGAPDRPLSAGQRREDAARKAQAAAILEELKQCLDQPSLA